MLLIKIGGGQQINLDFIAEDIPKLIADGEQIVLVHGASTTRDEIAQQLGVPSKTITSPSGITSVYTDNQAIDVFLMSYCGLVNKKIVHTLQQHDINAIGLSGIDGKLLQAKRKEVVYAQENGKTKIIRDNLTGRVEKVNADLLNLLLLNEYTPVICPPAISFDGEIVNTDNDHATAVIASALGIKKIIVLFEAPGMLKDATDEKSLIKSIAKDDLDTYMPYAVGRMRKKILGAKKAFELGVETIYWGDGKIKHPVINAIQGKGTIIK